MKATVTIETIGPERAQEMLDNIMEGQRDLRDSYMRRLSEEMTNDKFRLSSDAVVLIKGKLANGQHRLRAIVHSGKTAQFLMLKTDDGELYKVLDAGIKRSVGDVLGVENAKHIGAVANMALSYDRNVINVTGLSLKTPFRRSEILEYAEINMAELQEATAVIDSLYNKQKLLSRTCGAVFLLVASRKHKTKAMEFVKEVYLGEAGNTAAKDMRDRLIKNACSIAKLRSSVLLALMFKAFKSYLQGTRPGVFRIREDEEFPRL